MKARINSTIPVPASLDPQESARFYTGWLGFTQALTVDDYLIVQRSDIEIRFWLCGNRRIAEHISCYLCVPSTQTLFEEFIARGPKFVPPAARPWGVEELYVIDPRGNPLKLGKYTPA